MGDEIGRLGCWGQARSRTRRRGPPRPATAAPTDFAGRPSASHATSCCCGPVPDSLHTNRLRAREGVPRGRERTRNYWPE